LLLYLHDEAVLVCFSVDHGNVVCTGTLQKHLLRQDQRSDNDVLVALAGIKQVTCTCAVIIVVASATFDVVLFSPSLVCLSLC